MIIERDTGERLHPAILINCDTAAGTPITFHYPLEFLSVEEARRFAHLIGHVDNTAFLRWQLARKELNPALKTKGSGFEGHIAHLVYPERIVSEVAQSGCQSLDSVARWHKNNGFMQQLERFIHDPVHPIASVDLLLELHTQMNTNLARFRAIRSTQHTGINPQYKELVYAHADRLQSAYKTELEIDSSPNGIFSELTWRFPEPPKLSAVTLPAGLTSPVNDDALVDLNLRQAEGFRFMQEIGRIGDPCLRFTVAKFAI